MTDIIGILTVQRDEDGSNPRVTNQTFVLPDDPMFEFYERLFA